MTSDAPDSTALRDLAERVAREAGDLVLAGRAGGVEVASTKSSVVDVVTAVDTASERHIRDALRAVRPADGILGEELGHEPGTTGLTWVVDPIDGTVNFLYGIPAYAVSIAVVEGDPAEPGAWSAVAACVHAPAQGRTYTAARGLGAWRADAEGRRRLAVNAPAPLGESLVGTGFGYQAERRRAQGRVLRTILPRVRDIRRIGCASLDLCAVAAGELDGYFERGLKPWDLLGGALVVTEAGGTLTGLRGAPASETMVLAGSAETVAVLDEMLVALDADSDDDPAA